MFSNVFRSKFNHGIRLNVLLHPEGGFSPPATRSESSPPQGDGVSAVVTKVLDEVRPADEARKAGRGLFEPVGRT